MAHASTTFSKLCLSLIILRKIEISSSENLQGVVRMDYMRTGSTSLPKERLTHHHLLWRPQGCQHKMPVEYLQRGEHKEGSTVLYSDMVWGCLSLWLCEPQLYCWYNNIDLLFTTFNWLIARAKVERFSFSVGIWGGRNEWQRKRKRETKIREFK